jgi:hypothetical protein
MTLAAKIASCYWSTGVLESWSAGKSQNPDFNLDASFHYSTTPAGCRKRGKTIEDPSGSGPEPGPLSLDSLVLLGYSSSTNPSR